jgi:hypothetical protein
MTLTAGIELAVVRDWAQLVATIALGVIIAVLGSRLEHRRWLREQRWKVYAQLAAAMRTEFGAWLDWDNAKWQAEHDPSIDLSVVTDAERRWKDSLPEVSAVMTAVKLLGSENAYNRAMDWRGAVLREQEAENRAGPQEFSEASSAFLDAAKADLQQVEPLIRWRRKRVAPWT